MLNDLTGVFWKTLHLENERKSCETVGISVSSPFFCFTQCGIIKAWKRKRY